MGRKNLDTDISWFQNRPSTIENIALFAWRNIAVIMKPHPHDVDEVRVKVEGCWRGKEPGEGSGRWTVATYRGASGCLSITRGSGAQELMLELDRRNGAGLAVERTSPLVERAHPDRSRAGVLQVTTLVFRCVGKRNQRREESRFGRLSRNGRISGVILRRNEFESEAQCAQRRLSVARVLASLHTRPPQT